MPNRSFVTILNFIKILCSGTGLIIVPSQREGSRRARLSASITTLLESQFDLPNE
jgi:hypothetical protein